MHCGLVFGKHLTSIGNWSAENTYSDCFEVGLLPGRKSIRTQAMPLGGSDQEPTESGIRELQRDRNARCGKTLSVRTENVEILWFDGHLTVVVELLSFFKLAGCEDRSRELSRLQQHRLDLHRTVCGSFRCRPHGPCVHLRTNCN